MELKIPARLFQAETLGEAVGKAVLVSSALWIVGSVAFAFVVAGSPAELWAIPVLILVYWVVSWPFFAFGIVIGGLPLAWLFQRWGWWWGWAAIAPIVGTIAGSQLLNAIAIGDTAAWTSPGAFFSLAGLATGSPAGLIFWWYARSALTAR